MGYTYENLPNIFNLSLSHQFPLSFCSNDARIDRSLTCDPPMPV